MTRKNRHIPKRVYDGTKSCINRNFHLKDENNSVETASSSFRRQGTSLLLNYLFYFKTDF